MGNSDAERKRFYLESIDLSLRSVSIRNVRNPNGGFAVPARKRFYSGSEYADSYLLVVGEEHGKWEVSCEGDPRSITIPRAMYRAAVSGLGVTTRLGDITIRVSS